VAAQHLLHHRQGLDFFMSALAMNCEHVNRIQEYAIRPIHHLWDTLRSVHATPMLPNQKIVIAKNTTQSF